MKTLLQTFGLLALALGAAAQPVPPTTAFSRYLITSTNQAQARDRLGLTTGGVNLEEFAAVMATNVAGYAGTATNWVGSNYVTLAQYGATADATFAGAGTDFGAFVDAAVEARPATGGKWVIDGQWGRYTLNSGDIQIRGDAVKLQNLEIVITNVEPKYWITIAADYAEMENVFIRGPGTNFAVSGTDWQAKAGSVGITITNKNVDPFQDGNHAIDHVSLKNVVISGFATNIWAPSVKNLSLDGVTCVNPRYVGLLIGHADGVTVRNSHFTSWYYEDGFDAGYAFFATNTPNQWISNATPILVVGPANGLSFYTIGAGGGRMSMDIRNTTGLIIDGLHVEDVNNYQVVRSIVSLSNVIGADIRQAFMVKVTGALPDCFDYLIMDSPGPLINIESGSKWGSAPMVAAYYNPTAHGGGYLPAVSSAANRRAPVIGRAHTYRVLTDLTSMNGTDYVNTSPSGTKITADSVNQLFTGDNTFKGVTRFQVSAGDGIDQVWGANNGTSDLTGGNYNFEVVGISESGGRIGLFWWRDHQGSGTSQLEVGGNRAFPAPVKINFWTANSYASGSVQRWSFEGANFYPHSTLAAVGTAANPIGPVVLAGSRSTDNTYSGNSIAGLNAGATIAQWEVVYMGTGFEWLLADANGTGTFPAIGLAAAAGTDNNALTVVTGGVVRNDAWNWSVGPVYLSTTAGGLTQTAPSTTGDKIQVIGFALSADSMLVKPSSDYGTAP